LPPPPHESALLLLGVGTFFALAARAGPARPIVWETAVATAALATALVLLRRGDSPIIRKARLVAAYGYILWFYLSVRWIVPALQIALRDDTLRIADETLFGCLPALALQRIAAPWLTDILSVCYAGYLVYLYGALAHAFWRPTGETEQLCVPLYTAFAVGLTGYLLVPAIGPERAFAELFPTPLRGGVLTDLNAEWVAWGSSRYDVFPSLHVLIPLILLDHDRRFAPRRFRFMLLPTAGMMLATIYLRYHYAVDVAAGFVLFLLLRMGLAAVAHADNLVPSRTDGTNDRTSRPRGV
jgi:hypothetical protein